MADFFDSDVVASGVEQYVLFGIPTRAVATTFNGEYDLVSPYGSTGDEDEGIEIWLSGEEGEDEDGIFIRGTIECGVPGDLIAREIDTVDAWQDEDGTPHVLIAAGATRLFSLAILMLWGGWLLWRSDSKRKTRRAREGSLSFGSRQSPLTTFCPTTYRDTCCVSQAQMLPLGCLVVYSQQERASDRLECSVMFT